MSSGAGSGAARRCLGAALSLRFGLAVKQAKKSPTLPSAHGSAEGSAFTCIRVCFVALAPLFDVPSQQDGVVHVVVLAWLESDGHTAVDNVEPAVSLDRSVSVPSSGPKRNPSGCAWSTPVWVRIVHFKVAQGHPDSEDVRVVSHQVAQTCQAVVTEIRVAVLILVRLHNYLTALAGPEPHRARRVSKSSRSSVA